MNRGATSDPFLLFRSGSCVGALALKDVREVMRPLPVEPMRGSPPFVRGIALVRGIPSPVVDAAHLLGTADGAGDVNTPRRFISLRVGSRSACLSVDAVLTVRSLPREQLQDVPPLLRGADASVSPLLGALDRELLVVLDTARMVPDSVWTALQSTEIRA